MPQCFVTCCGNYYEKTRDEGKIIYHMLPSDRNLALKWIRACGRMEEKLVPNYARVCSDHFSNNCYQRDLQHELLGLPIRRRLIPGAVPDRNLSQVIREIPKSNISPNKSAISENKDNSIVVIKQKPINISVIKNTKVSKLSNDLTSQGEKQDCNNELKVSQIKDSKKIRHQPLKSKQTEVPILPSPLVTVKHTSIKNLQKTKTTSHKTSASKLKVPQIKNSKKIRPQPPNGKRTEVPILPRPLVTVKQIDIKNLQQTKTISQISTTQHLFEDPNEQNPLASTSQHVLKEKDDRIHCCKLNNKLNKMPMRSSYRIAKKKATEALSDAFTETVNSKAHSSTGPEHFTGKLRFMAKLQLKYGRNASPFPRCDFQNSLNRVVERKRFIKSLNKMQIMEDVREGCDANPPSSPGHAEQGENSVQIQEIKQDDSVGNGLVEAEIKSEIEISEVIKQEQYEKRSSDEINDKQEENSSNHSINSEINEKRKLEQDTPSIKRLKTEMEDSFTSRDKIIMEFMELAECNNLDQIQNFSDQIFSEIKALNELAREKEREWNQLLHMKKLKEELLIRLQRKRQVLIINDSDLNEFQPETNGQQSLLKCNQKVNMLKELRAANIEKLKQRTNMLQSAYKQKPMLDVQSIIADYRQRHPETVPRRGGSLTIGQSSTMDNHESGLSGSLNGFAKLSQSEKSELQTQMQNIKPPPPYPEVTVHPVTSTSSVTPTNSLLHGILTKTPVKQSQSNGNSNAAINGKSSFSPTLARLLTAPEKAAIQSSTPNMLGGSLLNASNMSISEIFSGSKVRNEITITPLGGQFETPNKRELIDEDEQTDRLVIDEALDNSSTRNKEDNRSEDGEDVPQCQGCNQQAAQFVCAGCGNQWYCSRDCQVAAWDDHSELCSG